MGRGDGERGRNGGVAYLWVGIGGRLGACTRYAVYQLAAARLGPGFPYGTFAVNATGSLAIGVIVTLLLARAADPAWRLVLVTGFLGGYTTFSAFSFESVTLLHDGRWGRAAVYVFGSNLLGLAACWAGVALGRALTR